MGDDDRSRWDERYAGLGLGLGPVLVEAVGPPSAFADIADAFPTDGALLEVACGDGREAVWFATRGLDVLAADVSPIAVALAGDLAVRAGVADRCRVEVVDLDHGLPLGPAVDVVVCHLFNAPHLDDAMVARLRPGGLLALAVLGEVGAAPGRFRVRPGELLDRFGGRDGLEVLDHREADGVARLLARRTDP